MDCRSGVCICIDFSLSIKNEDLLYRMFGINAELLIDHAWGWEPCTIADIKSYLQSVSIGVRFGVNWRNPILSKKVPKIIELLLFQFLCHINIDIHRSRNILVT